MFGFHPVFFYFWVVLALGTITFLVWYDYKDSTYSFKDFMVKNWSGEFGGAVLVFFMFLVLLLVVYLICTIHISCTNSNHYYTDFEPTNVTVIEELPYCDDKYIAFDEDNCTYTYYTLNKNTNTLEANVIPIRKTTIIPVDSDITPTVNHCVNENKYYRNNETNKIITLDVEYFDMNNESIYVFIVPENSVTTQLGIDT